MVDQSTKENDMASLGSYANVDGISPKSKLTSSAPFLNGDGGKMILISHPGRFYIDDILASDFGHRCLKQYRPVSSELNGNHLSVADTAAAEQRDDANIADSTISLNNYASSELDKFTGALALTSEVSMTASRPPSSSLTSSRRFHNNGMLAGTSSRNTGCDRRAALKDAVKMEHYGSINTELTANNDESRTICDVTSSTASHPVSALLEKNPGRKTDGKDGFTLPAWVYCTRYSDRPSAGPRIRRRLAGVGDRRRRHRTAFSADQLQQLRAEYDRCRYISDDRRRQLADRLGLHVTTIKIWFQNRRASDKKASGVCNELALRLMAEGLYDHHTVNMTTPIL